MKLTRGLAMGASALALLLTPLAVYAAGNWSTLPVIGGNSFCGSTVTGTGNLGGVTGQGQGTIGSICGQTIPAGPQSLTGLELIPSDLNSASNGGGGAPTQTAMIASGMLGGAPNRLIGGDFGTNLWQRGTTPLSAATPSTATLGADRWWAYSSGNTVTISKQTAAADTIPSQGLYASMRVSRPSGTNTTQICVGQTLDKQAAAPLIGNNGIFSFYALAGAGLSAVDANNNLTVNVAYYTAADSATPGTNTGTFAAGTITGYQAAIGGVSPGTTGTVASGVATIPISTTWTRYSVWAPIPATNAAGTAVTGVGVSVCYTPASGTGGSTEWFELAGAQLEAKASTTSLNLPNGIIAPSAFDRRYAAIEAELQYSYTSPGGLGTEVNGAVYMAGNCQASGTVNFPIMFDPPLRTAPTAATSTLTAGGYSIKTAASATAIGTITLPTATTTTATLTSNAACTTTLPYNLAGTNTTGLILFSAEP